MLWSTVRVESGICWSAISEWSACVVEQSCVGVVSPQFWWRRSPVNISALPLPLSVALVRWWLACCYALYRFYLDSDIYVCIMYISIHIYSTLWTSPHNQPLACWWIRRRYPRVAVWNLYSPVIVVVSWNLSFFSTKITSDSYNKMSQ